MVRLTFSCQTKDPKDSEHFLQNLGFWRWGGEKEGPRPHVKHRQYVKLRRLHIRPWATLSCLSRTLLLFGIRDSQVPVLGLLALPRFEQDIPAADVALHLELQALLAAAELQSFPKLLASLVPGSNTRNNVCSASSRRKLLRFGTL